MLERELVSPEELWMEDWTQRGIKQISAIDACRDPVNTRDFKLLKFILQQTFILQHHSQLYSWPVVNCHLKSKCFVLRSPPGR